ncbi:MAG: hypothetical protein ACD_45C00488G0001 [uncultured bacterium]|nr:MAG: hypothetical protein ACD_45C00488G0001 [uncultured bacterium]
MNLERLSKNALSYSSASMTKKGSRPILAETPKFSGMPPIKKPGCNPAHSNIQVSMLVVVVLPCVPETAKTQRFLKI